MRAQVLKACLLGVALLSPCGSPQTLLWNANTEPDLSHYRVYHDGSLVAAVGVTSFSGLRTGTYTVTAVDVSGNESAQSVPIVFNQNAPRRARNLTVAGKGDTAVVAVGDTVIIAFEATNMLENGTVVDKSTITYGLFYRYKSATTWLQVGTWRNLDEVGDTIVSLPVGPSVTVEFSVDLMCAGVRSIAATQTVFMRTKAMQGQSTWQAKRIKVVI